MSSHVRILGIAGSLRRGSYNQAALRAAKLLVPENSEIDLFSLMIFRCSMKMTRSAHHHQCWNSRAHSQRRCSSDRNARVQLLHPWSLEERDRLGLSAHGDSAWSGKAAAIMGASLGAIGTARAQYHLRQILVALNLFPLNQPEVVIADAAHRFDENGNLIHEPTKQLIRELLKNLVDWTSRISPAPERTSASSTATARHPLSGGAPA